jgi:hypothetical protein
MTNKEAFTEFYRGFAVGFGIIGMFILFTVIITPNDPTPEKKFEVVDRYDGQCNVVRYNRQEEGRYTYFLDCRQGRETVPFTE